MYAFIAFCQKSRYSKLLNLANIFCVYSARKYIFFSHVPFIFVSFSSGLVISKY